MLTREQVRRIDRIAIDRFGIPGVVLMENAGRSAAEEILKLAAGEVLRAGQTVGDLRVAIFCGGGNNGGDGYVIARHLHNAGARVSILSAVDPAKLSGDAAINRAIVERLKLPCRLARNDAELAACVEETQSAQIIVDALLGTGFSGAVRPDLAACIRHINRLGEGGRKIVAVDLPSGLDCDSGLPSDPVVRADLTVTFVDAKTGFARPEAQPLLGRVVIRDIGFKLPNDEL